MPFINLMITSDHDSLGIIFHLNHIVPGISTRGINFLLESYLYIIRVMELWAFRLALKFDK